MSANELCRILIVDDEILIRQGVKHYINWEQEGFTIAGEASNGMEALEMIRQSQPHIVLTDIVMPVMDGEELTREIKAAYPEIEVIVLSSFSEFEYVRSTFQSGVADYILKPKLEIQGLLKSLRNAASKVMSDRESEGRNLVNPPIEQTIERMIAGFDGSFDAGVVYDVFPLDYFFLQGIDLKRLQIDMDMDGLTRIIKAAMAEQLPYANSLTMTIDHNLLTVVNLADMPRDELHRAMLSISEAVTGHSPATVVVKSELFKNFTDIGKVYKESLHRLLQYSYFLTERQLISHDDLPIPIPPAGKFNLNQFTEELKRRNFEAAFHDLREHVAILSSSYATDVFEFKSFLSNMIFTITVLLGNMDYQVQELETTKYSYFNAIDQSRNAKQASDRLYRFIEESESVIKAASNLPVSENMKMLLDYIENHYAQPLSLKEMAKHFHFNPSYLSSYFTTHNKESFVDYLNRVRTNKACELLREDTAAISEISSLVGYSDHSYFCKVFKKATGYSPSQYRKLHLK